MIRGAFEYQGQKCSALSRAYIPKDIWKNIQKKYLDELSSIKIGSPRDFSNFMNAVIDQNAFNSIKKYINKSKINEIPDRANAIRKAIFDLQTGDILIVAGKGHEKIQEYKKYPFYFLRILKVLQH